MSEPADGMAYALQVGVRHGSAGWEAQAFFEKTFRRASADDFTIPEYRLCVHRLPDRSGFDIFVLQRQADILTACAKLFGLHRDNG